MSRAKYLNHLEREVSASRRVINDLVQRNHELELLLRDANRSRSRDEPQEPPSQKRR